MKSKPTSPTPDTKLVEIYRTTDKMIELQVLCEVLKNNNIPAMVSGEAAEHIYGIIVDGIAEKRILVKAEDASRAKQIINKTIKTQSNRKM